MKKVFPPLFVVFNCIYFFWKIENFETNTFQFSHNVDLWLKNNATLMTTWNCYSVSKLKNITVSHWIICILSCPTFFFPSKWPAKSTKFSKYNKKLIFVLSYLFGCFTSCQNSFGSSKVSKKDRWKSLRTLQ